MGDAGGTVQRTASSGCCTLRVTSSIQKRRDAARRPTRGCAGTGSSPTRRNSSRSVHHLTTYGFTRLWATAQSGSEMLTALQLPATVDGSLSTTATVQSPGLKTRRRVGSPAASPNACSSLTKSAAPTEFASLYDPPTHRHPGAAGSSVHARRSERSQSLAEPAASSRSIRDISGRAVGMRRRPKTDGSSSADTMIPTSWDEVDTSGPPLRVCNPFAKQPNEAARTTRTGRRGISSRFQTM